MNEKKSIDMKYSMNEIVMISTIVVVVDHGMAGRIIEDLEDGIFPASVRLRAIISDGEVMQDEECILLVRKRILSLRKWL